MPRQQVVTNGEMVCSKCKLSKSTSKFSKNKANKTGLDSICLKCACQRAKRWQLKHRDKVLPKKRAWYHANREREENNRLKRLYGITVCDLANMVQRQRNRCAICNQELPVGMDRHVDHDHSNGKVRGVLCKKCNHLLGDARDSIFILQRAINYLRRNGEMAVVEKSVQETLEL